MSNGPNKDFEDFGSSGLDPLDGDLLGGMSPTEGQLEDAGEKIEVPPSALIEPLDEAAAEEETPKAEEKREKRARWAGLIPTLVASNPYTVMLAVSLAALLIGILCLLLEWGSYRFDTKAKGLQQSAAAAAVDGRIPIDCVA